MTYIRLDVQNSHTLLKVSAYEKNVTIEKEFRDAHLAEYSKPISSENAKLHSFSSGACPKKGNEAGEGSRE